MKKITWMLMILVVISARTNAQIPNSGFENWLNVGKTIAPESWYSFYSLVDSSGTYSPVTRSTDHFPVATGSYSVRISNDTGLWNSGNKPGSLLGWGILLSTRMDGKPLFPVTGHPLALCGYYKFNPQNSDTMNINIFLYKNGTEITQGRLQSSTATPNWTAFKVYVNDTLYNSADSARITFSACNEKKNGSTGPRGNSELFIDNISFYYQITTSIREIRTQPEISLYPNPVKDRLTIVLPAGLKGNSILRIVDLYGKQVFLRVISGNPASVSEDASHWAPGTYFVQVIDGNQISSVQKMTVAR